MKVQHYVSYVVGMLLTFPIRVFHLLSPEGSGFAQEKKNPHEIKNYPTTKAENYSNMQGIKRTCGQSQRSARLARKEKNLRRK